MKKFYLLVFVSFLFASCNQNSNRRGIYDEDYVAKINNQVINFKEYEYRLEKFIRFFKIELTPESNYQIKKLVLDEAIEEVILFNEIQRRGIEIDIESINDRAQVDINPLEEAANIWLREIDVEPQQWMNDYKVFLQKQQFFKNFLYDRIQITEGMIQNYYKENEEQFVIPASREVLHLQVDSKDLAILLHLKLVEGFSFSELVRQYSIASDKVFDGNMGIINKNVLPTIFDEVIFSLTFKKPLSNVVKSQFGYHIFKLKNIINEKKLSLVESRDIVINKLKTDLQGKVYKEFIESQKQRYEIQINEEYLQQESIL